MSFRLLPLLTLSSCCCLVAGSYWSYWLLDCCYNEQMDILMNMKHASQFQYRSNRVSFFCLFFATFSYTRTLNLKLYLYLYKYLLYFPRFSRNSLIHVSCWLPWKRGQPTTSSTLTMTPWWHWGSSWSIEKTSSRRNVTPCTSSRESEYFERVFLV